MCCTCDALRAIEAAHSGQTVVFGWSDVPTVALEVEIEGTEPEGPANFRLRSDKKWTDWFDTKDLAGTFLRLGTDVKWRYVNPTIQDWLTAKTEFTEAVERCVVGVTGGG